MDDAAESNLGLVRRMFEVYTAHDFDTLRERSSPRTWSGACDAFFTKIWGPQLRPVQERFKPQD